MRNRAKRLAACLVAVAVLFVMAGVASAGHISVSSRTFRGTWTALEFISSLGTVRCPVTLEGSLHSSTIAKVAETLIGQVYRASLAEARCSGGRATVRTETLPWHVRYLGFEGTLPKITALGIDSVGESYAIETGRGDRCIEISASATGVPRWEWEVIVSIEPFAFFRWLFNRNRRTPLRGEILCELAGEMTMEGEGTITVTGGTTAITVRLI